MPIDLRREQEATLQRPAFDYTPLARAFTASMDLVAGAETSLAKAKLLEVLADVPYRAWERLGRASLTLGDDARAKACRDLVRWSQEARHNENQHLAIVTERMGQLAEPDPWYLRQPMRFGAVAFYAAFVNLLAAVNPRRAYQFNAEFEDHAEHTYARYAADHPEWDDEAASGPAVAQYAEKTGAHLATWGDVLRRIALDERDHRNRSFLASGMAEEVVHYEGGPDRDGSSPHD
jgi:hypothetical protein